MTQRMVMAFMELPGLMRLGVFVLLVGGTLDLLYHVAPPGWSIWLAEYLGLDDMLAHVVTLLGMVVTLLGLFVRRARVRVAPIAVAPSEGRSTIER